MGYIQIYRSYKKNIIAMGVFVAWLWAFPLFGVLQENLSHYNNQLLTFNIFNLLFLTGTALGFLVTYFLKSRKFIQSLTYCAPIANLIFTTGIALICWLIPDVIETQQYFLVYFLYFFFPVLMGISTAIFFTSWGITIFKISPNNRGKYMGAMVACASFFNFIILLISRLAPLPALVLAGMLLGFPAYFSHPRRSIFKDYEHEDQGLIEFLTHTGGRTDTGPFMPWRSFWLPFALILLCFYILSWITLQTIFPLIREETIIAPVLGQAFYGLVALGGGLLLDREEEIEKVALLGLAMLGCTFLFFPIAMSLQMLLPLQILLESSYALIDLFIWVTLAAAASFLRGNPRHYYSLGLFLNIIFIIAGLALASFLKVNTEGTSIFHLSMVAGIILFMGTLPALALRYIRISSKNDPRLSEQISKEINTLLEKESFSLDLLTHKEKKVISLMLAGCKNADIEEKLGISKNTLKTHVRHIYEKTGTKNRSELLFKFGGYIRSG